jgi:acetoacetate decarboxylase
VSCNFQDKPSKQALGFNLKLIPGVDCRAEICQSVMINLREINVKGSWFGPRRLHLIPHVNASVADFRVRRV